MVDSGNAPRDNMASHAGHAQATIARGTWIYFAIENKLDVAIVEPFQIRRGHVSAVYKHDKVCSS